MQSIMDKLFGRDWKTTLSGCLFAAGYALEMNVPSGPWHIVGKVAAAVGGSLGLVLAKDSRREK